MSDLPSVPIILIDKRRGIVFRATPEYLIASYNFERKESIIRRFNHIDDLHTLTVYGLTRLAREFHSELIGGKYDSQNSGTGDAPVPSQETRE